MFAFLTSAGAVRPRRIAAAVGATTPRPRTAAVGRRVLTVTRALATGTKEEDKQYVLWGDGNDGSKCKPADTEFARKFADRRGAKVPTVTDAMLKFNECFGRPVPSVYRNIVNELVTLGHLSVVCPMWSYDELYGHGLEGIFERFFSFYPNEEEKELLQKCVVGALEGLNREKTKKDSETVKQFVEGKSESEVLSAIQSDSTDHPVLAALNKVKNSTWMDWYYSRNFGFGLIFLIESLGGELTEANAGRWAEAINLSPTKLKDEMSVYLFSVERLKQAEQMFADVAARDKKKTADRLSEQAAAARKEVENEEKSQDY